MKRFPLLRYLGGTRRTVSQGTGMLLEGRVTKTMRPGETGGCIIPMNRGQNPGLNRDGGGVHSPLDRALQAHAR